MSQNKAIPVAWMFWRGGKPSQRWSKDHLTLDDKHTLCGLRVPDAFKFDHSGSGDYCTKCNKISAGQLSETLDD